MEEQKNARTGSVARCKGRRGQVRGGAEEQLSSGGGEEEQGRRCYRGVLCEECVVGRAADELIVPARASQPIRNREQSAKEEERVARNGNASRKTMSRRDVSSWIVRPTTNEKGTGLTQTRDCALTSLAWPP
eukprot:1320106-Rhodomonas_salina.4